jgi:hypothetical protein
MGLQVEQTVKHQPRKTPTNGTNGVHLGELLDFLTTAKSHGIPDGACVRFQEGVNKYLKVIIVEWKEDR